ncbi:hypothetical protein Tco_0819158 [Tanacetum coccineum]|uniref:Uncharacterized protein n=1 Tax=Tanacetum coccineum TaxID=301880 RepID=A0ABQ5AA22_9ASTR
MHKRHREEIGQSSRTMITTCPGGCLLLLISIFLSDSDCLNVRSLTQSSQQLQRPSSELKAAIIFRSDGDKEDQWVEVLSLEPTTIRFSKQAQQLSNEKCSAAGAHERLSAPNFTIEYKDFGDVAYGLRFFVERSGF